MTTRTKEIKIKCLVWDLDNTLWAGTLLEDGQVTPLPQAVTTIKTLDQRGILQSIASKNDHDLAWSRLVAMGLADYFIYPQIHWEPKSDSVARIAKSINIGLDTIAFIDDQPYEREEVAYAHPEVMCLAAEAVADLPDMAAFHPRFITEDSRQRRAMYQSDIRRNQEEESFAGPKDAFLATLDMVFTIAPARQEDLQRAEELTVRTNQLNTTGYTYSYEELDFFRQSPDHLLLVATLEDKFGTYGKIGLVLLECHPKTWRIKLLLMSCRVMSRGVGGVLINHVRHLARQAGVTLESEMIVNDRNRMMLMTYKFNHFHEVGREDNRLLFENDLTREQKFPNFIKLVIE